ncbi:uncharacterized protein LOC122938340 isoform X2 [Bufo gargarizans]|uniref:uncharacterized protein LOC122938340 isoform X2 n=1 Tax=Bufo gargarizans TaxID=30331 RepID=UPI001CF449FA|nr:uncharacterized protein LOC122938340 isoform X2 [Bufo gargarizans]
MKSFFQMCLALGLAAFLYSAPVPHSSPPQWTLDDALDVYNEGLSSAGFLFGILQDNLRDKFIIKETVCVKSAEKDGKCPFKEDGVVKRCTASKPEGRRLEVRCQTIDIAGEENTKSETARNHHIFKDLRNDRKKAESSFMQIEKDSVSSHAVFSCLHCIFDFLNPKTSSKDSGR